MSYCCIFNFYDKYIFICIYVYMCTSGHYHYYYLLFDCINVYIFFDLVQVVFCVVEEVLVCILDFSIAHVCNEALL